MGDAFVTWEMINNYPTLVALIFMFVEFTKELKWVRVFPTKYYAFVVALGLILIARFHSGEFALWDIVLYVMTAIGISLGSNGLNNFNAKSRALKEQQTIETTPFTEDSQTP